MRRPILWLALMALVSACEDVPCDDTLVELAPQAVTLGDSARTYVYFSATEGAVMTRDATTIPHRSAHAVLISRPIDNLPIGVVLMSDAREGEPETAFPVMRDDAAEYALQGLLAGWAADNIGQTAMLLAEESPDSDAAADDLEEAERLKKLLGREPSQSRSNLDRERRRRWAESMYPKRIDVGLIDGEPRNDWAFGRESCPAPVDNARIIDIDTDTEGLAALKLLAGWSGVEPSVPAIWKPGLPDGQ